MKTGAGRKKKDVEDAPKPRASRKKTFPVVAVINADGEIQGTLVPEKKKPLIALLPFSSKEVLFHDGRLTMTLGRRGRSGGIRWNHGCI